MLLSVWRILYHILCARAGGAMLRMGRRNGCFNIVGAFVPPLRGLIYFRACSGGSACFACSTPGYLCVAPFGALRYTTARPKKPRRGGTFIAGDGARTARNPRNAFEERTNPEGVAQLFRRHRNTHCATPSGFDSLLRRYRGFRMLRMLHPRLYMCRPIRGFALQPSRGVVPPHSGLCGRAGARHARISWNFFGACAHSSGLCGRETLNIDRAAREPQFIVYRPRKKYKRTPLRETTEYATICALLGDQAGFGQRVRA